MRTLKVVILVVVHGLFLFNVPAHGEVAAPLVRLNNDTEYQAALDMLLKASPAETAPITERISYFNKVAIAEGQMRHYGKAEEYTLKIIHLDPTWSIGHAMLSVYLGKQGKYKEAAAEARKAIDLDPENAMYANLVLASWECHLGQKEEALKRVSAIAVPNTQAEKRTYYGCLACFYASVGDEAMIAGAIQIALDLDLNKSFLKFLQRDVILDSYRGKEWFIKLAGKTLLDDTPQK